VRGPEGKTPRKRSGERDYDSVPRALPFAGMSEFVLLGLLASSESKMDDLMSPNNENAEIAEMAAPGPAEFSDLFGQLVAPAVKRLSSLAPRPFRRGS
jgi:hypothetical protein